MAFKELLNLEQSSAHIGLAIMPSGKSCTLDGRQVVFDNRLIIGLQGFHLCFQVVQLYDELCNVNFSLAYLIAHFHFW